ncbi:hypothetical protein SAMN05660900_03106, partial [Megasphaera cerevisiae DSM 20462]
ILPTGTTVEGKTGLKMAAVSKSGFCAVDINYYTVKVSDRQCCLCNISKSVGTC